MKTPNRRAKGRGRRAQASRPDLDVVKADLARLKENFVTLLSHLAAGPDAGVQGVALKAIGRIGGEALRVCDRLARETEALRLRVEQWPWSSVLAACALGVIVAQLGDRRPNDTNDR